MKNIVLAILLLSSVLTTRAQVAAELRTGQPTQSSGGARPGKLPSLAEQAGETLPDNYQVTLTMNDKEAPPVQVFVVIASTKFRASPGEPSLRFNGDLTVEDSGGFLMAYLLEWEFVVTTESSTQFKSASVQGSIRLKPGEEMQILRAGTRTVGLAVKKLEGTKSK